MDKAWQWDPVRLLPGPNLLYQRHFTSSLHVAVQIVTLRLYPMTLPTRHYNLDKPAVSKDTVTVVECFVRRACRFFPGLDEVRSLFVHLLLIQPTDALISSLIDHHSARNDLRPGRRAGTDTSA